MTAPNELSFLPEDYLEQKYTRRANVVCGILFVLAAAGIVTGWTWMRDSNKRIEANFAQVDARYLDAARKIEQVKRMHEQQSEVFHHAELADSLVEKVPRSNILAEITNSLPTGVSLLDLSLHSMPHHPDTAASSFAQRKASIEAQGAPGSQLQLFDVNLTITGIASDDVQVAQLMTHLSHSPLFENVNLVISDTYTEPHTEGAKTDKAPRLRRWQIETMVNPQAEVREETKTAAVELAK